MSDFISKLAPPGWKPQVGDYVIGQDRNGEMVTGIVVPVRRKPKQPKVYDFSGYVILYILTLSGEEVAIREVRPA